MKLRECGTAQRARGNLHREVHFAPCHGQACPRPSIRFLSGTGHLAPLVWTLLNKVNTRRQDDLRGLPLERIMFFPMPLDRFHRNSTKVVMVIVPLALLIPAWMLPPGLPLWPRVLLPLLVMVVLGLAWAMAPRGVELKGGEVRVLRRAWAPLRIPITEVAGVETGPSLVGALRVLGTGGFFGSYGLFYAAGVGWFRLYATRGTGPVIIRRQGLLPVVVTPEDASALVEAVNVYRDPEAHL